MGTFLGTPNGPYFAWATSHVVHLISGNYVNNNLWGTPKTKAPRL